MIAARRHGARPDQDFDARIAQQAEPSSRDARVRIFQRADDARDAGGDDRLGARRREAVMRARLQRDVKRRAARGGAGFIERASLGVRPSALLRDASSDDDAVVEQ